MRTRILESEDSLKITLEPRFGGAARQAAFLLMDRAYVFIDEGDSGRPQVILRLKRPGGRTELGVLARDFRAEVHTQRIRLALERVGRAQRRSFLKEAVGRG